MHIIWKLYLIGGACVCAYFVFAMMSVLLSPPPPEGEAASDAMMGPVLLAIFYGITATCVWRSVQKMPF
nr:hypothetical protein [Candidatus Sigynarchaeum springense]